jgi:aerobic carbon-monoxide dehydrogenase medium subunit
VQLALFRPEQFVQPSDSDETLSKLKSEGKRAHVIAGGTGFYELAKRGFIPEVKTVVSIMKLGLSYVKRENSHIQIGATTTLQDLLESKVGDLKGLEALGDALREIRPQQVRNVATIGGEVCISVPIVDLPIALLACKAKLVLMKAREVDSEQDLESFYLDAFLTKLKYGEIVKQVNVPIPHRNERAGSAFTKLGRTAYDFNLVNAAVRLKLDANSGGLDSIEIFLGGIHRTPLRATEIEKKLVGKKSIDERTIIETAKAMFSKNTNLLPSVHGSSEYKRGILPIIIRDCFNKAYARANAT